MKIRQMFVSNSSSSSYVVIGIQIDENLETRKKILDQLNIDYSVKPGDYYSEEDKIYDLFWNLEGVLSANEESLTYIGKVICNVSSDGDYLETENFDLVETIDEIKERIKKMGLDETKLQIYTGTRSC